MEKIQQNAPDFMSMRHSGKTEMLITVTWNPNQDDLLTQNITVLCIFFLKFPYWIIHNCGFFMTFSHMYKRYFNLNRPHYPLWCTNTPAVPTFFLANPHFASIHILFVWICICLFVWSDNISQGWFQNHRREIIYRSMPSSLTANSS